MHHTGKGFVASEVLLPKAQGLPTARGILCEDRRRCLGEGRDAAPWTGLLGEINARLAGSRMKVHAPEPAGASLWQVRIETADGLVDFVQGPTPTKAWASAMAWLGE